MLESSLDRELDAQVIGGSHLPLSSALWDKVPSNHQYHGHRSFDRRGYVGTPTEVHESNLLPVFTSSDYEYKPHGSQRALGGSRDDFTVSAVIYSFSVPHTIFLTDAKSDVG